MSMLGNIKIISLISVEHSTVQFVPLKIPMCSVVFVVKLLHEGSSQFGAKKAWGKVKLIGVKASISVLVPASYLM